MKIARMLVAVALACTSFVASATVITFEDLSGQNNLGGSYAGLTWGSGWEHYGFSQPPFNANSGTQRVYNNANDESDFFRFASDVVFAGAFFSGLNNAQFELYNDGVLVSTSSTLALSGTPTFLSSGYSGLIDEVRLNVTNGQFVMDDVTYDSTQQVPEPATLALLGLGLAGLGLMRRKGTKA